ncbi:hypothetical protein [Pedobacter borealis]|uniref:hypothetical protein n=1 Tax=Pedobacter borealis TaxID=475254 RepID=UPI0009F8AF69|nr:hypothetical protein [Pedobacter borealis]
MKKLHTITLMLLLFATAASAQTWGEWFNQKSTQRKYLLEQIAALRVYKGYLEKGYGIVKDGTGIIRGIKNGDFNIHSGFFNGLELVNPRIKSYDKVEAIITMNNSMMQQRQKALRIVQNSGQFRPDEMKTLRSLYSNLSEEAAKDLEELLLIVQDGQLKLSDDERIKRIEELYIRMQNKSVFQRSLNKNVTDLVSGRKRQIKDVQNSRLLFGLQ